MNRSKALLPLLLFAAFSLSSCSGPKGKVVCTVNCGVGNGSVIVTVTSTPSQTFYFPYLEWVISSVQLVNTSGTTTVIQGAPPPVEFARLQTDSQFLGKASSVPAGTYTSAIIHLAPSTAFSFFYNSSNATLLGCAPGATCQITNTVPGFGAATVTVPVSFTVTGNNNTGFSLNFDLSKAVTTAGGMTFDFTKTGAITLATLPRAGQSSGSLDSFQNFTGNVTAVTATSFGMGSLSSDTRTFTMAAIAQFDDPFTPSICTAPASFKCIAVNQNLSVDAVINSDGTLTAYEVEFLDKFAQETEGIIVTPVTNNQFKMVVTNGMGTTFLPGTLATVNVNATSSYSVDPKNLGVSATSLVGFQSSTDLVMGQTVMLLGGSADFTNNSLSGYTRTLLRYSSIGGTIQTPNGTIFTLSGVSPFYTNLATNSVQVQTFANTTYDNITGGFSGLAIGTNASVRGLYLNPTSGATQPLLAAKVRVHLP
jgi:hypothetical protein